MNNVYRMLGGLGIWAVISGIQGEYWYMWTWLGAPGHETPWQVMAWVVTFILGIAIWVFIAAHWKENKLNFKFMYRMLASFGAWAVISGLQGEFWGIFTWLSRPGQTALGWSVATLLAGAAIIWTLDTWEDK